MRGLARSLTPELLDLLPGDDPRAARSRHDLVRINFIMRQQAIMARSLLGACPPPRLLVDLGSGDGRFLLGVAKRLASHWPGVRVVIADMQDIVSESTKAGFAALGWSCEKSIGDVFETLGQLESADIVTANLFLHHFDDETLARLLKAVAAHSRCFVACEPRRSLAALTASRLVFVLGANDVTRHDAVASVRAGFTGQDLSALWPRDRRWTLAERSAPPFSHSFLATKNAD